MRQHEQQTSEGGLWFSLDSPYNGGKYRKMLVIYIGWGKALSPERQCNARNMERQQLQCSI